MRGFTLKSTRARIQGESPRRQGRPPATTHAALERIGLALFAEHGYDETSVDDIARAAGIGRRTFFCYFPSKADLVWGDFDANCEALRRELAAAPADRPMMLAIRDAVIASNRIESGTEDVQRQRTRLILHSPTVVASSINRYQQWRAVLEEFVGERMALPPDSLIPRTVAYGWMGLVLAAYEQWVSSNGLDLADMVQESLEAVLEQFEQLRAVYQV
jgi:TetR/AcrR family transcriptional regulator, regulator of mycofactocin system